MFQVAGFRMLLIVSEAVHHVVSVNVFQLVFVANVPAFGLSSYTLHGMAIGERQQGVLAKVNIYNSAHSSLRLDTG